MRISLRLAALLLGMAVITPTLAQTATGAIDARTFERLMKAQEHTEAGEHSRALAELEQLRGTSDRMSSYARSQMWNFYAFIYANQNEYRKAIDAYERVLKEEGTTDGNALTARYTIAQLYFQLEDYANCIRFMEQWLREVEQPTPTAHIMLAQAYYQTEVYDKALHNVATATRLEVAAGKPVPESWLGLAAALYYAKNDYESTARVYEQLIARYPKVSYLRQLAGMYSELGRDLRRLAVYDAVYEHGALSSESELLNLAYMFLGQNMPYKAGRIIELGMEQGVIARSPRNVETLANAWAAASEHRKAVPALLEAARLSDSGMLHARLAGVHFDAGDYAKAAEAAAVADQKGGLRNAPGNLLLMGMAHYNDGKLEDALQAFRRAKQSRSVFQDASRWEEYTRNEIERLRSLARARRELQQRTEEALEADENNVEALGIGG